MGVDIELMVMKWFDMKCNTYSKLEQNHSIYLYDFGNIFADIRVDKSDNVVYYRIELWKEFTDVFQLHYVNYNEFNKFLRKWVKNAFKIKNFKLFTDQFSPMYMLKLPNK